MEIYDREILETDAYATAICSRARAHLERSGELAFVTGGPAASTQARTRNAQIVQLKSKSLSHAAVLTINCAVSHIQLLSFSIFPPLSLHSLSAARNGARSAANVKPDPRDADFYLADIDE